jgi:hypothetical protein
MPGGIHGGMIGGCMGGCTGDARGMPGGCLGDFKNPFQKNHALAQSLLSLVFSWDVKCAFLPHKL